MYPRNHMAKTQDVVAGVALILIGSIGFIARLGFLDFDQLPKNVQYGWPLLLIAVGVVLLLAQIASDRCLRHARPSAGSRETNYVR